MTSADRLKRWARFSVAIAFSAVFSYLFISGIDIHQVSESLAAADYYYVGPALALFAASLVVRSLRWRVFFQPERDVPWQKLLPSLIVGYAGNNLLPLRAGELLRAQHLSDHAAVPRMQTFGTLLMERLFDGVVLATFVLWGLLVVDAGNAYLGVGLALGAVSLGGFAVCLLLANHPDLPARIARLSIPLLRDHHREQLAGLSRSFLDGWSVLRRPRLLLLAALTSAAAWGLELGMYWLVSRAFSLDVSLISIAFAGAAANVAMSLPSAQGGVGPFQYFAKEALLKFGVPTSAAAAYALALHLFLVVPVSLAGLAVLWRSTLPGRRPAPAPTPAPTSAILDTTDA
jgi:uncharacterized protein (TIRG00374 family)